MPVYNSARYLAESIGSILSSTFKDLEIILVDDGSTDGSGAICDSFAGEDRPIRVIHQSNAGASHARNKGLEAATGTFVAFVDSDDLVTPRMYEKLVSAAEPGFDIAFCDMLLRFQDCDVAQETFRLGPDRSQTLRNLLLSGIGGGPCHMIVRRSLIGDLRFPEHIHSGEDLWFTLRLFTSAGAVTKVEGPLYIYNQENTCSITHSSDSKYEKSLIQGMEENRSFLEQSGLFDKVGSAFYWAVLRYKSRFALDPDRLSLYRTIIPEANRYTPSCPLVSFRVKIIMIMLDFHLDVLVRILIRMFHS
ncbi:MAG: glycosyltransferase [Bacteroidales bacterium]|nr:glycosyltransferase [Bacteroidales bacterium]